MSMMRYVFGHDTLNSCHRHTVSDSGCTQKSDSIKRGTTEQAVRCYEAVGHLTFKEKETYFSRSTHGCIRREAGNQDVGYRITKLAHTDTKRVIDTIRAPRQQCL